MPHFTEEKADVQGGEAAHFSSSVVSLDGNQEGLA